jgi:hypothetical protein
VQIHFGGAIQIAMLVSALSFLLTGCSKTGGGSSSADVGSADGDVFGDFESVDVSGVVVKINNHVPRDGGAFLFTIRTRNDETVMLTLPGPSRHHEPSDSEITLYRGALNIRVGDWVQVTMNSGAVTGFRLRRK